MSKVPHVVLSHTVQGECRVQLANGVAVSQLDFRLREVERKARSGPYQKKKEALAVELEDFLRQIPGGGDLGTVNDLNLRRFLVYKDGKGKTQVHVSGCVHLGSNGVKDCGCPRRLAEGTVQSLIGKLKAIFRRRGRGDNWDEAREMGNPACAFKVGDYLKVVKGEFSEARVTPKQAKPLFLGKLEIICDYLGREAEGVGVTAKDRFIYLRDRAFFCLQFYAGDRAGDLCKMVAQEVRRLPGAEGLVIRHTQGKTASASTPNTFVVRPCGNKIVCPITNLEAYIRGAGVMGIDLKVGHLFRKTGQSGIVLEAPMSYDVAYDRLKDCLVSLGIYEGETPHSLRGGCAVTMRLTGAAKGAEELAKHIGWRSSKMPHRYSRASGAQDMDVSKRLQGAVDGSVMYNFDFDAYYVPGIYNTLPDAISRLNEPGQLWRLIDTLYLYNFDPAILLPYCNHMTINAFMMSVFPQISMLAPWR